MIDADKTIEELEIELDRLKNSLNDDMDIKERSETNDLISQVKGLISQKKVSKWLENT